MGPLLLGFAVGVVAGYGLAQFWPLISGQSVARDEIERLQAELEELRGEAK